MMSTFRKITGAAAVLLVCSGAWAASQALTFYVATNGKDSWSGRLAEPNATRTDGPFATLERAVVVTRRARQTGPQPAAARVILRAGTYFLAAPIRLGPEDSGLTIAAAKGETVIVSGGRRVVGWRPWKGRILQADLAKLDLPDLDFHELYYNAELEQWARAPNFDPQRPRHGGWLYNAGIAAAKTKTLFEYRAGDLHPEKWAHPERAWMMFHDALNYQTHLCAVKSIDRVKRIIEASKGGYVLSRGDPFYLCGIMEELDAPGEWCVDPDAKILRFWPPQGDPNAADTVVVPALASAFVLQGDAGHGQWVTGVRIDGLAVRDCRGRAVQMIGVRDCSVARCDLRNVEVGVFMGDDTYACKVIGCDITQTQGDGITITGSSMDHERVTDHVVDNNTIWNIGLGRIHNRCGGVYMHRCMRCKVTHNDIYATPRYAIGMDVGGNCEIAYNICHHTNLVTADTSIVEAATALDWHLPMAEQVARNPKWNWGNSIHHNLLYDSGGWKTQGSGVTEYPSYSWGVYLDTYASGWHVYDNVIYDTVKGAYMVNGGVDNVFENNICIDGKESQCYLETWPKYAMSGEVVQHNIFAYHGKRASLYSNPRFTIENGIYRENLVWANGDRVTVRGVRGMSLRDSWNGWLKLGQDKGTVVADPQFVDPAHHDYRLKPTSPAFGIGFKPIDLSTVGCYAGADRRTWPCVDHKVPGDTADYTPPARVDKPQTPLRTYEDYTVGEPERNANVGNKGAGTALVTDETGAPGADGKPSAHSLKFTDAAGLPATFFPYVTYPLAQESGTLTMSFDLRWQNGALMALDWRDDPYYYNMGPNLTTSADSWLSANGKRLCQLPDGKWVHIRIVCGLGPQATGKYELTLRLPGAEPQVYKDVACSPKFETLNCVVFMSVTDGPSVFYIDNLAFRPAPRPHG